MQKPPTQSAGVVGIAPEKFVMNEAPTTTLPWQFIASLPPFQMFAAERMRNTSGKDSELHAQDFICAKGSEQDLFDEYSAWHAARGYWPNETPMGESQERADWAVAAAKVSMTRANLAVGAFSGTGYLGGESPGGTTTVGGVPVPAEVRILWRDPDGSSLDGCVVARTFSAPDGTWRVDGLNTGLQFDVVGRKANFNDVIVANVSPKEA